MQSKLVISSSLSGAFKSFAEANIRRGSVSVGYINERRICWKLELNAEAEPGISDEL